MLERKRCWGSGNSLMEKYHDEEWGVKIKDDNKLFERMSLEMFQAGLSWRTVLHKRVALRKAFSDFSIPKVAEFSEEDVKRLLQDSSIIRNELKIRSVIYNARKIMELKRNFRSFDGWLNSLDVDDENVYKEFKKQFKFMGPGVVESFLMSVGRIEVHHMEGCWKAK